MKSGIQVKCCWCQTMADTSETVLVNGVFPVHTKCKAEFVARNQAQGFLNPKIESRLSFGIAESKTKFIGVDTGIVLTTKQFAAVWKGKYIFNFDRNEKTPALKFE